MRSNVLRQVCCRHAALLACLLAISLGIGCSEPAEVLAEHFEAMALIAEDNAEDCSAAGEALSSYLHSHDGEMREAAAKLGESSEAQARRINVASQRLDTVVESCRKDAPAMESFAQDLSALVLESTELD